MRVRLSRALRYTISAFDLGAVGLSAAGEAHSAAGDHGIGNAYARPGQINAMCPNGRSLGGSVVGNKGDGCSIP